jgi:acyl-coenzyme A thioesterase PaaI-like protein
VPPDVPPPFRELQKTSAFSRHVGPIYEAADESGRRFGFRVATQHINLGGFAHGGMIATFADVVLGQFEGRDFERLTVTIRLVADFIGTAGLGEWVEGRGRIIRQTRTLVFAEADITCRRRTIMTAQAVFKILDRKPAVSPAAN